MRSHLVILAAAAMLASTLALSPRLRDDSHPDPDRASHEREVVRLRAHFDSVDAELRERDVLGLSHRQKSSRATLIGWLRAYRDEGVFPRNDRFPDRAMPFFRDSRGVLCAMAYLIDRSGRGDLVDEVASTRNNAFIAELADDPELRAWLDSVGLTVSEAARIQPSYGGTGGIVEEDVDAGYAVSSVLVSGASLATLGLNMFGPSRSTGTAGVLVGSMSAIAGAVNLDGNNGTQTVAAANIIIGGAAIAAGVYRLINRRAAGPADGLSRQSAGTDKPPAVSPIVIQTADGARLGLAMNAPF
jgi:hypothetical protein